MSDENPTTGCTKHGRYESCGHTTETCPEGNPDVEKYLESARPVGDFYLKFVSALANNQPILEEGLEILPVSVQKIFKAMHRNTEKHGTMLAERKSAKNMSAFDFLAQVFPPEKIALLEQTNRYRVEELSTGLFCIFIDQELFSELHPEHGAQAMAVKTKNEDSVPFIIYPEFTGIDLGVARQRLEENIPHELNHLVWGFMEKEGATFTTEDNDDIKKAFLLYREELLCRLSTDGTVGGYDHVRPGKEARVQLERKDPKTLLDIDTWHTTIYTICHDLQSKLNNKAKIKKPDLILAIMEAQNFAELVSNLEKIQTFVQTNELPVQEIKGNGWETL